MDARRVLVGGGVATSVRRQVAAHEPLVVKPPPARFVARSGAKLDAALERFGITVDGRAALDAGSSTGGFTDCLLQRGASSVLAVDVGTNQLHEHLRADPRVSVLEQTDIRRLDRSGVDQRIDLVVADLSFISLRSVAGTLVRLAGTGGDVVVLVKPQFEATKVEADRGRGIIRDPDVWRRTLGEVVGALEAAGAAIMGAMCSPIRGSQGNTEFLLHVQNGDGRPTPIDLGATLDATVTEAVAP